MGVSYLIIMVPWKMQLSESHVSNSENFLNNLKLRRHQEWKVSDVVLIPINVEKLISEKSRTRRKWKNCPSDFLLNSSGVSLGFLRSFFWLLRISSGLLRVSSDCPNDFTDSDVNLNTYIFWVPSGFLRVPSGFLLTPSEFLRGFFGVSSGFLRVSSPNVVQPSSRVLSRFSARVTDLTKSSHWN